MNGLRIIHACSRAGGSANEDAQGSSARAAWVVDGATGLSTRRFTSDESDARWFARAVSAALARRADDLSLQPAEVLAAAIEEVAAAFRELAADGFVALEAPSASVAFVRVHGERLEYAVLGDCAVLARTPEPGAPLHVVRDARVAELERPILARLAELRRAGVSDLDELRAELIPLVLAMRALMNRPEGYWVMGLDPAAAAHALTGELDAREGMPIVLASDGFTRLFETYDACTAEDFHERAVAEGFDALYRSLRDIERADAEVLRFPRLKPCDDATGLTARITAAAA